MDIIVKVSIPQYIYRFYKQASQHIANSSPEELMADALSAYAGLLSDQVAKEREQEIQISDAISDNRSIKPSPEGKAFQVPINSSTSRSR